MGTSPRIPTAKLQQKEKEREREKLTVKRNMIKFFRFRFERRHVVGIWKEEDGKRLYRLQLFGHIAIRRIELQIR